MCKKILIINQGYIRNNIGDQAIRVALNRYFKEKDYEIEWSFLTSPRSKKDPLPKDNYITNIKNDYRKKVRNRLLIVISILKWLFLNTLHIKRKCNKKYDYVIIGGGQLFNSSNSFYPHSFSYSIFLWTFFSKFYKNKIIFLGVGSNNKFNVLEKFFYRISLKKATKVFCRDYYSMSSFLSNFQVKSDLLPDVAFYDYYPIKDEPVRQIFSISVYSFDEFNSNYNEEKKVHEEYYDIWVDMLKKGLRENDEIHFFSTTSTDYEENNKFNKYIQKRKLFEGHKIVIHNIGDLNKLYGLFIKSRIVLSARMHALLIAYKLHSTPLVFEISDKLRTFNKEYLLGKNSPSFYKQKIKEQLDVYF